MKLTLAQVGWCSQHLPDGGPESDGRLSDLQTQARHEMGTRSWVVCFASCGLAYERFPIEAKFGYSDFTP